MAPNPKVVAAFRAMSALGITESQVKPVLKKLLKLYDKNWELIEEENYRALADAIFEAAEHPVPEQKKKSKNVHQEEMEDEEAQMHVDSAQPLKRSHLRVQDGQSSNPLTNSSPGSAASPLKKPKLEGDILPESSSRQRPQNTAVSSDINARSESRPIPPHDGTVDRGKQPLSPQVARRRRLISERERAALSAQSKEPTVEPGMRPLPNNKMPHSHAVIIPKDEPIDELPDYAVPVTMIPPEPSSMRNSPMMNGAARKRDGHITKASLQFRDETVRDEDIHPSSNEEATSNVEIASSTLGEVKISLRCSFAVGRPEYRMPSQDQILQMMEEKCLRSYKITDPNFSVPKLLKDICDCMLEFRNDSNDDSQKKSWTTSNVDVMKESDAHGILSSRGNEDPNMLSHTSNGSINVKSSAALVSPRSPFSVAEVSGLDDAVRASLKDKTTNILESNYSKEPENLMSPNSHSLAVVPQHNQLTDIRSIHDVNDLTKGEEIVQIPWVNDTTNDFLPPFHYIPQNLVFRDANVSISLSCIGGEDCCSTCMGNCVLLSTQCACANKTGAEFAYTAEGLLKEDFLEECIAISHNPQQHYFYCKDCPLERSKDDGCLEPCKGHLKRKFIKECWTKCGCGKQCGNRVVQRGITGKLQVFFTPEGKGWGLRTLEDLPKGAFVCEFVGEILTTEELNERNMKCTGNGSYTYPIVLDADWDSRFVKDEDALCLDAASFGNVARFINHRCSDANLVEIPVEIEGPGHHYYHCAFFTSRKIVAQEELTWDYGIDFDDSDHPVKLFQCRCGSKFCRNMKRSNRSTRSASAASS
ncbi:PREDICTED: probable inactive histone-lysine N-methyltransferase SUVR2 [Lupinus angustifolius]|uniref:probable inactive histone-lysine N-methyltransferase SUVR2 n=1 Tax=Lupinus angustifolius TaxID=3871 RepID=UPI00092F26F4|nr:PREDICTED: probable inactive histone-lysine N-methyltransferase SUVR2 [Lupinus angustifolius]